MFFISFRVTPPLAPNLPEEDDEDAPAWARRHLGMLVDLGDMGMVLARDLVRRVSAETQALEAAAEAGLSLTRAPAWPGDRSGAELYADIAGGAADHIAGGADAAGDRGRRVRPGQ